MLTGEPGPQHRDIQFGRFHHAGMGGIGAEVGQIAEIGPQGVGRDAPLGAQMTAELGDGVLQRVGHRRHAAPRPRPKQAPNPGFERITRKLPRVIHRKPFCDDVP